MNDDIRLSVDAGVAVITFTRSEALNTFTAGMIDGLSEAYRHCDRDDAVRVVVVTGEGRAFCAGADLSGGGETFGSQEDEAFSSCPLGFQAWELRKPVIAACNGHAIGVGMGIASQCDLRIVAEEGKYSFRQVRLGVIADFAAHYTLPRLVGLETALDLLVSGRTLTGREAVEIGLAGRVCPAENVLPTALELARDLAENTSPLAAGISKRLVWKGLDMTREQMVEAETLLLHHTMGRPDAIEGGMAFFEKRAPQWRSSVNGDWPDDC